MVPTFRTPEDLQAQIQERLKTIAAEDLAPWCKLGNIVFRATEVVDGGDRIAVTARVRADTVAHALEALRGERGMRGDDARFTWAGRSKYVRIQSAEATTTTTRSRTIRLALEVIEPPRDYNLKMSVGKLTPDDLTEAALKAALFGAQNPLADQHMGFFAEMTDPLEGLRDSKVSDEIVRPLAELLVTDSLVGSRRASRVTEFKLGASVRGIRRLSLSWEAPRRYTNERSQTRTISGDVRL